MLYCIFVSFRDEIKKIDNNFESCSHAERLFHDVHDNYMRYQYLTRYLGDPQNKKQKYEFFKTSPMNHVMILSTFYF